MEKIDYKILFEQFKADLNALVAKILIENGIEKNADLISSIDFIPNDSGMSMLANDYYQYVSTGRKPKARKVPIDDLIAWVKKYKIGSGNVNNTAWAIQQSIYRNGIKGKNYLEKVDESVADLSSEKLAEFLSVVIADDMVAVFDPLIKK